MNDANACAVAERRFGAGSSPRNTLDGITAQAVGEAAEPGTRPPGRSLPRAAGSSAGGAP